MVDALAQVLAFGVAVALSPFPIIAVVPILTSAGGRGRGVAFLVGWWVGLVVLAAVALLLLDVAEHAVDDGSSALLPGWAQLASGVALMWLGVRQWRSRPRGEEGKSTPAWMSKVESMGAPGTLVVGLLLAAANPKVILLGVGAMSAVAVEAPDVAGQVAAVLAFSLVGSIGAAVPVFIALGMPERSAELLGRIRAWMTSNEAAIMATLLLVIGARLVGDGLCAVA